MLNWLQSVAQTFPSAPTAIPLSVDLDGSPAGKGEKTVTLPAVDTR